MSYVKSVNELGATIPNDTFKKDSQKQMTGNFPQMQSSSFLNKLCNMCVYFFFFEHRT